MNVKKIVITESQLKRWLSDLQFCQVYAFELRSGELYSRLVEIVSELNSKIKDGESYEERSKTEE